MDKNLNIIQDMEHNIEKLVSDFANNIQKNISEIQAKSITIKNKIQILRETYSGLIEDNSHKQIFLFCLESFNFQNKKIMVFKNMYFIF